MKSKNINSLKKIIEKSKTSKDNSNELTDKSMRGFKSSKILNRFSLKILLELLPDIKYVKCVYDMSEDGIQEEKVKQLIGGIKGSLIILKTDKGIIGGIYSEGELSSQSNNKNVKMFVYSIENKSVYNMKDYFCIISVDNKKLNYTIGSEVIRLFD